MNAAQPAARATQKLDREQVRMLVLALGYQSASQRTGIKPATLRKWAERGKWWTKTKPHAQAVTTVTTPPAVALTDELSENERETRLSLSRFARNASKHAEEATLREAKAVKAVAETAAITHGWRGKEEKDQGQVAINIAILG